MSPLNCCPSFVQHSLAMPRTPKQNRTPLHFASLLIPGLILALLQVACGKSSTRKPAPHESDLIGKWTAVEMSLGGNRGPTKGILEARTEFFADQTSTGVLVWNKTATANPAALGPHPWSSTWTITNGLLLQKHGTNELGSSDVWFEEDLLTIQPRPLRPNSLTLILKRSE